MISRGGSFANDILSPPFGTDPATTQWAQQHNNDVQFALNKRGSLANTNTWTGKQFFADLPWADVMAYGAVGDNSTDDTAAVQAAIDHMYNTYGAGMVFFPPLLFRVASGITLKGGVYLWGSGRLKTGITLNTDHTLVTFDSSCSYAGIYHMKVQGFLNNSATQDVVVVSNNVPVDLNDCDIWGGRYAINTGGIDGSIKNCFISGFTGCVLSIGANWWERCKMDDQGSVTVHTVAFAQGAAPGGATSNENHFNQCDFSVNTVPATNSITINDTGSSPRAITTFVGCVIAEPVTVTNGLWTSFIGCEFGGTAITVGTNQTSFAASWAQSAVVISGAGKKLDSACFNLS